MIILLPLLLSCGNEPVSDPGGVEELDAPRLLRRLSLDLRGVVPSIEELNAVEADPSLIEDYQQQFLEDPRLEERLVDLFAEHWHTRIDDFLALSVDFGFGIDDEFVYERSVGEETLRLMAHVAVEDLPWSEIVTAEYTMANEILGAAWPLDYPEGETGWQPTHYTDGRPGVGVLSTNALWWRFYTTDSNLNRGRAAAMSRLLLCNDILARPVEFSGGSVSLLDTDGISEAIRTDPYCVSCHSTLEPLASAFFGFWWHPQESAYEISTYHAEREPLGVDYLGVEPEYYGYPIRGLADLGLQVSEDPRFARCTAETMAQLLWRRDTGVDDYAKIEDLRQAFELSGLNLKTLITAILETPTYRAGGVAQDAPDSVVDREITARLLSPDQLDSAVEDLTGFQWRVPQGTFQQLANDTYGYRVMAGGIDGTTVLEHQVDATLTWALVVKRLAQGAAYYVVENDIHQEASEPTLLAGVDMQSVPGEEAFTALLEDLFWRLHGVRPSADDLAGIEALWTEVDADTDVYEAWRVVVWVLLNDPLFVTY